MGLIIYSCNTGQEEYYISIDIISPTPAQPQHQHVQCQVKQTHRSWRLSKKQAKSTQELWKVNLLKIVSGVCTYW